MLAGMLWRGTVNSCPSPLCLSLPLGTTVSHARVSRSCTSAASRRAAVTSKDGPRPSRTRRPGSSTTRSRSMMPGRPVGHGSPAVPRGGHGPRCWGQTARGPGVSTARLRLTWTAAATLILSRRPLPTHFPYVDAARHRGADSRTSGLHPCREFWGGVAEGFSVIEAGACADVSRATAKRLFSISGGVVPPSRKPAGAGSRRRLSCADECVEREEIARLDASGGGVREIARRLGRDPGAIGRDQETAMRASDLTQRPRCVTACWIKRAVAVDGPELCAVGRSRGVHGQLSLHPFLSISPRGVSDGVESLMDRTMTDQRNQEWGTSRLTLSRRISYGPEEPGDIYL